jgi:hypothetical protein
MGTEPETLLLKAHLSQRTCPHAGNSDAVPGLGVAVCRREFDARSPLYPATTCVTFRRRIGQVSFSLFPRASSPALPNKLPAPAGERVQGATATMAAAAGLRFLI